MDLGYFSSLLHTVSENIVNLPAKVVNSIQTEQSNFLSEQSKYSADKEAAPVPVPKQLIPPWKDFSLTDKKEEEQVRNQILSLTSSKRNFLNAPPDDSFDFVLDDYLPLAQVCLEQDPKLSKVRFWLVPQYIREPKFWRSYFYRVALIKAAHGLEAPGLKGHALEAMEKRKAANGKLRRAHQTRSLTSPKVEIAAKAASEKKPEEAEVSWTDKLKEELGELGIDNEITIPDEEEHAQAFEADGRTKSWEEELEIELKAELEDFETIPSDSLGDEQK